MGGPSANHDIKSQRRLGGSNPGWSGIHDAMADHRNTGKGENVAQSHDER